MVNRGWVACAKVKWQNTTRIRSSLPGEILQFWVQRWAAGVIQGGERSIWLEENVGAVWGVPHPPSFFQEGSLGLFSSRASQVTFRLRIKRSLGLTGWRAWAGRWLLLPLCLPAGFAHRLQLPLHRSLTQATSGPPLSHCLPREAPGGN